ncbi:hypothetical protein Q31b_02580 [Novipirellula aureliae]|uniref:Vitamin K-dependent gamma-carboxylase n=1 Tax=Novipirellula aureliae TaxID=2527966 RepID=A0A5C6EAX8_9BACT|nr:hypothetical protein [Novipirellula aureliae]TWU45087.1 hypothetical protein Q31b_02580 [Novipirellula aureliae]
MSKWWLPRIWAAGLLLLITFSHPLWFGGPANIDSVLTAPLFSYPANSAKWSTWLTTITILVACASVLFGSRYSRTMWWVITASLVFSFLLNQHRLQPWAYQSAIYAAVFASMSVAQAKRWLVMIAASIYLYSGIGKIDFQFVHTVGQDFLNAVWFPGIGRFADQFDAPTMVRLAYALPISEALVAIALLIPWSRRTAGLCAIGMHLSLLAILGPWNLDHSAGVLCWNVLLVAQAWFLFVCPSLELEADSEKMAPEGETQRPHPVASRFSMAIVIVAVVMPLGERFGYWDHWTSWALYSPHTSRVEIEIHESAIDRLPVEIVPFLSDVDGDHWNKLDLSRWSISHLNVPIYPQSRYQLTIANRLANQFELRDAIRVFVKGVSDRRTGRREVQSLLGQRAINERFRQNASRRLSETMACHPRVLFRQKPLNVIGVLANPTTNFKTR